MASTRSIAEFVVAMGYGQIPAAAVEAAKGAILDSIGVALAGSGDEAGRIAAELAREEGAKGEAAVFGQGFRSSAPSAAFVNGVAGHAMDFDASFTIQGQPTSGLASAVFALAEPLGASGRQVLEAYVAGYEVTGKLAWCVPALGDEGGWHSTGTLDSFGCALAAAKLLGLDVEPTRMALGIVASMASGIVANFGTMSKPLHAGLAARNGVLAARLAQKGYTASATVLDDGGGFFATFGRDLDCNLAPLDTLGQSFEVERGVRYKAYPCGGLTHTAIDAVLALRQEHNLTADAIDHIDVKVSIATARRIIFRVPETELQSKFSMPYIVARAVLDGTLTADTFTEAAIREPAALALLERVSMEADPELEPNGSGGRPARVWIHMKDGRTLSRQVDHPKGSPQSPLTDEELKGKFVACARRTLSEKAVSESMAMLGRLETLENVRPLTALLLGDASGR
jgi:2-methylcitrate dehydratase PrpD